MKNFKKTLALSLAAAMTISSMATAAPSDAMAAAKKVKSIKKVTVNGTNVKKGKTVTVTQGTKLTIAVKTVTPAKVNKKAANKKAKNFKYKSSKKKFATVSSKGVITAKKAGTTTITVTSKKNKKAKFKFKVKVVASKKVKAISVSPAKKTIVAGKSFNIKAKVTKPKNVIGRFTYKSDNKAVATVNASGKVTARKAGKAKITVTSKDNKKLKKTVNVTVTAKKVAVTGVSLKLSASTIYVGGTATATATVAPSNATNKAVTFTSNNTSVATVDAKGTIKGVKAGSAKITVTTADGKKTATQTINVKAKETTPTAVTVSKVDVSPASAEVEVGKTTKLTATVTTTGTNKSVTWKSSDDTVAIVSDGTVTGVKEGTATITATSVADPTKSGQAVITVKAAAPANEETIEVKAKDGYYAAGVDKDAKSYTVKSNALSANFKVNAKTVKGDVDTFASRAKKDWTIDTVYDMLKSDNLSTYTSLQTLFDAKYATAGSFNVANQIDKFEKVGEAQKLTSEKWWSLTEAAKGTEFDISGDGVWAYSATATGDVEDFMVELFADPTPGANGADGKPDGYYYTTLSNGEAWFAEAANHTAGATEPVSDTHEKESIGYAKDQKAFVVIVRKGDNFDVTYYKDGAEAIHYNTTNELMPKDLKIHFCAQFGEMSDVQFMKADLPVNVANQIDKFEKVGEAQKLTSEAWWSLTEAAKGTEFDISGDGVWAYSATAIGDVEDFMVELFADPTPGANGADGKPDGYYYTTLSNGDAWFAEAASHTAGASEPVSDTHEKESIGYAKDQKAFVVIVRKGDNFDVTYYKDGAEAIHYNTTNELMPKDLKIHFCTQFGEMSDVQFMKADFSHTAGIPVKDGETVVVDFKTTAKAAATDAWHGALYVLYGGKEGKVNGDGYNEIFVGRGDNYGWSPAGNTNANNLGDGYKYDSNGIVTSVEDLKKGVKGTIAATRSGDKIEIAFVQGNALNTLTYTKKIDDNAYISLLGDQADITDISYITDKSYDTNAFDKYISLGNDKGMNASVIKYEDEIFVSVAGNYNMAISKLKLDETADKHTLTSSVTVGGKTREIVTVINKTDGNKIEIFDKAFSNDAVATLDASTNYSFKVNEGYVKSVCGELGITNPFEGMSIVVTGK